MPRVTHFRCRAWNAVHSCVLLSYRIKQLGPVLSSTVPSVTRFHSKTIDVTDSAHARVDIVPTNLLAEGKRFYERIALYEDGVQYTYDKGKKQCTKTELPPGSWRDLGVAGKENGFLHLYPSCCVLRASCFVLRSSVFGVLSVSFVLLLPLTPPPFVGLMRPPQNVAISLCVRDVDSIANATQRQRYVQSTS